MRMMMLVDLPLEPFNTAVRNGTAGPKMKKILDAIKPEAAYFGERDGNRGGILIVNLESPPMFPGSPSHGSSPSTPRSSSGLP